MTGAAHKCILVTLRSLNILREQDTPTWQLLIWFDFFFPPNFLFPYILFQCSPFPCALTSSQFQANISCQSPFSFVLQPPFFKLCNHSLSKAVGKVLGARVVLSQNFHPCLWHLGNIWVDVANPRERFVFKSALIQDPSKLKPFCNSMKISLQNNF